MTPEPSFWRSESDNLPKGFAVQAVHLSGQNANSFDVADLFKQILSLRAGSLSLLRPQLASPGL